MPPLSLIDWAKLLPAFKSSKGNANEDILLLPNPVLQAKELKIPGFGASMKRGLSAVATCDFFHGVYFIVDYSIHLLF